MNESTNYNLNSDYLRFQAYVYHLNAPTGATRWTHPLQNETQQVILYQLAMLAQLFHNTAQFKTSSLVVYRACPKTWVASPILFYMQQS